MKLMERGAIHQRLLVMVYAVSETGPQGDFSRRTAILSPRGNKWFYE